MHLLVHEVAHTLQGFGKAHEVQKAGKLRPLATASPVLQRSPGSKPAAEGLVKAVRISCEDELIVLDTNTGHYSYTLTNCDLPLGEYVVGVTVTGSDFHLDFDSVLEQGRGFEFGYRYEHDQINPATLFDGQTAVAVSVVEHLSVGHESSAPTAKLKSRLASFQQLVKAAGKLRMAHNRSALSHWRPNV